MLHNIAYRVDRDPQPITVLTKNDPIQVLTEYLPNALGDPQVLLETTDLDQCLLIAKEEFRLVAVTS